MEIPKITLNVGIQETKNFAKQWNFNGVAIPLDDVACQFATDFANVCLSNAWPVFIQYCQEQAKAMMAKAQQQQKKVTLE